MSEAEENEDSQSTASISDDEECGIYDIEKEAIIDEDHTSLVRLDHEGEVIANNLACISPNAFIESSSPPEEKDHIGDPSCLSSSLLFASSEGEDSKEVQPREVKREWIPLSEELSREQCDELMAGYMTKNNNRVYNYKICKVHVDCEHVYRIRRAANETSGKYFVEQSGEHNVEGLPKDPEKALMSKAEKRASKLAKQASKRSRNNFVYQAWNPVAFHLTRAQCRKVSEGYKTLSHRGKCLKYLYCVLHANCNHTLRIRKDEDSDDLYSIDETGQHAFPSQSSRIISDKHFEFNSNFDAEIGFGEISDAAMKSVSNGPDLLTSSSENIDMRVWKEETTSAKAIKRRKLEIRQELLKIELELLEMNSD